MSVKRDGGDVGGRKVTQKREQGDDVLLGVSADGTLLLGAKEAAFAGTHVDSRAEESQPTAGSMDEFVASKSEDGAVLRQLRNTIKKCGNCGKPCAFSMAVCNGCCTQLPAETTHSHNIFMGFAYGVSRGPFPFTISMRRQTEDYIVFDDLLALTPCHLNVIPTNAWIPDWRFLLRRPAEGLRLVCSLEDAAWSCVENDFLGNPTWRAKFHKHDTAGCTAQEMRQHVVAGCNFPPSQYQLHIQYFLMPWVPAHYKMYLNGDHMTKHRFFPLEYIKAVLGLGDTVDVHMETDVGELIERFKAKGVDYDEYHEAAMLQAGHSHRALANWKADDFALALPKDATHIGDTPSDKLIAADKTTLQNYGRPYAAGKPTGTYYKFARTKRIAEW